MTLLLVNHHYISPRTGSGAIFPVNTHEMIKRAKKLELDGFQYLNDFRNYFTDNMEEENQKFFHFTFDDGLQEQYHAYDELMESGYSPSYFISTEKYTSGNIDSVHLIHYIRHKHKDDVILKALEIDLESIASLALKATDQYRYDTLSAACLKYLLNFELDISYVRNKLSTLLTNDCHECLSKLYMNIDQIKELSMAAVVGSHSHTHVALGTLPKHCQDEEMEKSKSFFDHHNISVDTISYPYGGPSAIPNDEVVSGYFKFGIAMERGVNTSESNKYQLKRVDTNEIKSEAYKNYA